MIKSNAIVEPTPYKEKWKLVLNEPNEKDSTVEISNIPKETIAVRTDLFPAPKDFFSGEIGELKRADYVIIFNLNEKWYSVFVEMKRGKKDSSLLVKQLKGALCVYRYIEEVGKSFQGEPDFLKGSKLRFLAFLNTGLNKKTTRPEKSSKGKGYPETPEKFLKVTGGKYHVLDRLIGKMIP
ncbi:MAG: hypothetical protein H3C46_12145 [Ignavibacteria bacterium]|nr:hypothetical protein [Ignavibacteria bacterium]